ncbi:MAG: hypothetical protein EP330_06785 [Deltaproteobacteria bacterium]|nr:MAG: hypothetical protein EP330_06785 [Deltaproteobacteria bacterium]
MVLRRLRRFFSGPTPWHLASLLFGTPIFAIGVIVWSVACVRIVLRGRISGLFMMALPLLLVAFDGMGVLATLWTVRRKIWTIAGPYMAMPVTSWSAAGWGVIAAGQGFFLGFGGIGLWLLAPARVDED